MHFSSGIDGVWHCLETSQQAIAKAFHQDAAMPRQYFGSDDTDEVCPSPNGEVLMLSHETHQLDKIDQQDNRFLLHKSNIPNIARLCPGGLLPAFMQRIIVHVDPTTQPRRRHPRSYGNASQDVGQDEI